MVGRKDSTFPRKISLLDRKVEATVLDIDAYARQVFEILWRDWRYDKTFLRHILYDSVGGEARQGFSHGAYADIERLADGVNAHLRAWSEMPIEQVRFERLVSLGCLA